MYARTAARIASRVARVSAVSLLVLASAREARAEAGMAPPRCEPTLAPDGANVPANLPAFVIDPSGSTLGAIPTLTVTRVTGGTTPPVLGQIADPHTPGANLLVPSTNDLLQVGTTYAIEYTAKCSNGATAGPRTASIQAVTAVALPTKIGDAAARERGGADVTPTAELSAFLRTTRIEAFVDGVTKGTSPYGLSVAHNVLDVRVNRTTISAGGAGVYFTDVCSSVTAAERHDVKLVAHVAGADADTEALSFSTAIDCSGTPFGSTSGGTSSGAVSDGGDDPGSSGGASAGSDDGGCSTSGSAPFGRLAGIFLAGAGVAALLRRRRSSHAGR